jgi:uncharacterized membrane protein
MTRDELDALWRDPAHWNPDTSYRCAADPRLFVPKRDGGGWTVNMEHPKAQLAMWTFLFVIVAVVVAVGVVAARSQAHSS